MFHSGQVCHELVSPLTVVLPQIFFNLTTHLSIFVVVALYIVWQKERDEAIIVSNKLHGILPKLWDKLLTFCNTTKEDGSN